MLQRIPKRRRKVIITAFLGVGVIVLILIGMYLLTPAKTNYLPGKNKEGLTTDLNRDIPNDYPRVAFADVAKSAGIIFNHFIGERTTQLPEDMGSGAAWGDYDNDGWLDLFVVNFSGPLTKEGVPSQDSPAACALYHNNRDGTFTEVGRQAGVDIKCWGMAAAWGDYDNDRWQDLLITTYGRNHLFHNNHDGTFTESSDKAGIANYDGFWSGAAWGDLNRDGYIDLYICGYVKYTYQPLSQQSTKYDVDGPPSLNPSSFPPERNLFFKNNGNGTFTEIGKKVGVDNVSGRSLSVVVADFDADEWPDIYVANDISDNAMYKNKGDGTFEDVSTIAQVADYRGAMGLGVGDWDGDGDYDIFISHWIAEENALYTNLFNQLSSNDHASPVMKFTDEADRYGLGQIALDFIGWGTSFFDYNNDGRPDLFVSNGSTFEQKDNTRLLVPMRNLLFWNKGNTEGFFEVSSVSGEVFAQEFVGRGAAFGDYDNDGDVDIFILNNGGLAQLLRNDGGNQNNWLEVWLEGVRSNSIGIGVKMKVVTNLSSQVQQAGAQGPYCSQNSPVQHFGLGQATRIDTLEVNWPSGKKQKFLDLPVNQIIKIVEGQKDVHPL